MQMEALNGRRQQEAVGPNNDVLKRNIEAERLLKRALRIARKTHSHPSLASMLHNLGVVERSLQRALVITERILDPEHPFVAASLDRLGFLYEDLHRYERAETLFSRSLAIREKAFGPDHPKSQLRSIISRGSRSCGRTV
jgi:tetratricopeptide (TPR) repeat protein